MTPQAYQLDDFTYLTLIEVPEPKIVTLQAYFDTAEGLGILRTLDKKQGLIGILCTKSMLETCHKLLCSVKKEIKWRQVSQDLDVTQYLPS